jgi:ketosteroid isomerase-like protein
MNETGEQVGRPAGDGRRSEQRILSMTPDGNTLSSIEAVLHQRIDDIAHAIRDKDVDRLMSFYARGVVVFDVRPPLDIHGVEAYRHNFERWFASFEGPLSFDYVELRIVPGEFTAFCHYLAMVVGSRAQGRTSGYWVRGTTCFERRDGEWLVTHEHISMPASM